MSMHEFENCVEESVRTLAASRRAKELDLRSLFKELYEFEGRYDTGFTRFRVIEILLEHRFAYAFKLAEHPDYERYGEQLLLRNGILVDRNPRKENARTSRTAAYVLDPEEMRRIRPGSYRSEMKGLHVVCEAGSELWERLVATGRLHGPDARVPLPIPIEEVALTVAREAEAQGKRGLIREWFALLIIDLLCWEPDFDPDVFAAKKSIREFRSIARKAAIWDYPTDDDYGMVRWPAKEELADVPGAAWWFRLEEGSNAAARWE